MRKPLTTEQWKERAKKVHGNHWCYDKSNYIDNQTKVCIICPVHGEFWQTPHAHLRGQGCPKCGSIIKKRSLNTEEWKEIAKKVHNNFYGYPLVDYKNSKSKVCITCPIHGDFWQQAYSHLDGKGCAKCDNKNMSTEDWKEKANKVHNNFYGYPLVDYKNNRLKVKITCPIHGVFEQRPNTHLNGSGCLKCAIESRSKKNIKKLEYFFQKGNEIHAGKYDYSNINESNYINMNTKVCIICPIHGEFWQKPSSHLLGQGCPKCSPSARKTNEEFKKQAIELHGDVYGYPLVDYKGCNIKVKIICPIHGVFEQTPADHLRSRGCPNCSTGLTKSYKLRLLNDLESSDLLIMDPIELSIIIRQGKLPNDFGVLTHSDPGTNERIKTIGELKERFKKQEDLEESIDIDSINTEFIEIDELDCEITKEYEIEKLPSINIITELKSIDNCATMDEDAFDSLKQYKLMKLWNKVLNDELDVKTFKYEDGGKYFSLIKKEFLDEYKIVSKYKPPIGYSFKYDPNLMQKLTVHRLLKNKSYGNWSGTGAGKTLSFIIASREIDARVTLIIAINSTINQTITAIKETYPDSLTFTEYKNKFVFDRTKHNYLILNYEKFQQEYSKEMCQSITNNNQIDFIVIDEVHSVKQRYEIVESTRHNIINSLLGIIRQNNPNTYTMVMSATPVINSLYEAKSLLKLMTGLDYDDINTFRTIANAQNIFQQLILNGIRFIPKYDIKITELTGHNMSNLNIDGSHLLNELLLIPQQNYLQAEKLLIDDKLISIKTYLRKGVIIYTNYTTDIVNKIESFVRELGFKTGTYTGDEDTFTRENNLNNFIDGKIDILIGSRPIGTGVDGLQNVCDRMILITLPWTDSEYTQLKGRIYRQGSNFDNVEFIIPQVKIQIEGNDVWSWDIERLNLIKHKKTLSDCAVDGVIPSKMLPSPETMYRKSIEALELWKERINNGDIISAERNKLDFDLYPEITNSDKRRKRIESEINEVHRRANTSLSSTTHTEFANDAQSWFRYHKLRNERMEKWSEIPYEYIAAKIKNRDQIIADFGCGENKFKSCLSNKVYSFDHVAFDDSVIACDMKNVPLDNESIHAAVFSLSLWGVNYEDYIKEAYRVLKYSGLIYIAEPAKSYDTQELRDTLKNILINNNFEIVGDIECRGKFIYLKGLK